MYPYPSSSARRKSLAPLFAGMAAAVIFIGVGFLFFTRAHPAGAPPSTTAAATKELLECLVCGKPVDPDTTQFKLNYKGQRLYFDRQECLDAFVADPNRYGHLRVDVSWSAVPSGAPTTPTGEVSAVPPPGGSESPCAPPPETEDSVAPPADSSAPDDNASTPESLPPPDEMSGSPTDTDSGAPTDCGSSPARDPNPPPLHQSHHHHHHHGCGDDGGPHDHDDDQPAPAPSSSGDEDVPQPPCSSK